MKTKRFMLFAGENCYPNGGMEDFVDSFDTLEGAKQHLAKQYVCDVMPAPQYEGKITFEWAEIYDIENGHHWRVKLGKRNSENVWTNSQREYSWVEGKRE